MIEIPSDADRACLAALELAAIYVIAPPAGTPVEIGYGLDISGGTLALARRCWPLQAELAATIWTDAAEARWLHAATCRALALVRTRVGFACTVATAEAAIRAEADLHQIGVTDHSVIMARVHAPPREIEAELAEALFSRKYRSHRLAAAAAGTPPMEHWIARERLDAALANHVAKATDPAQAVAEVDHLFEQVFADRPGA